MAPLSLILIAFLFTVPWVGLEVLQTVEARDSYYAEQAQARRVRAYFEQRGDTRPRVAGGFRTLLPIQTVFCESLQSKLPGSRGCDRPISRAWFFATPGHVRSPERSFPGMPRWSKQMAPYRRWRGCCPRRALWPCPHAAQLDLDVRRIRPAVKGRAETGPIRCSPERWDPRLSTGQLSTDKGLDVHMVIYTLYTQGPTFEESHRQNRQRTGLPTDIDLTTGPAFSQRAGVPKW